MATYTELKKHFSINCKTKEYPVHTSKVHSVSWNCDGRRLASGSFDKSVVTFILDKDRLTKDNAFRGHTDSVDQLCWHPTNPDLLVTASGVVSEFCQASPQKWCRGVGFVANFLKPNLSPSCHKMQFNFILQDITWGDGTFKDKTVRIWDARVRKNITVVNTKGENINICWSPDGQTIAVGNKEDLVTFIDVKTHKARCEEQLKFEVNEIIWNNEGDLFFLTSGQGSIHIWSYPELQPQMVIPAHPANCICIEFDPMGRYFATGSADALVSLWDLTELICVRTFSRLDWPVRTLSFSHDGRMLASASEDLLIDIADVETGEKIADISCESPTFTVSWHPKRHLLAYACDDKDKYERDRDAGTVKVFGFSDSRD